MWVGMVGQRRFTEDYHVLLHKIHTPQQCDCSTRPSILSIVATFDVDVYIECSRYREDTLGFTVVFPNHCQTRISLKDSKETSVTGRLDRRVVAVLAVVPW